MRETLFKDEKIEVGDIVYPLWYDERYPYKVTTIWITYVEAMDKEGYRRTFHIDDLVIISKGLQVDY